MVQVLSMVLTRKISELEIGVQKGRAEVGDQFLVGVVLPMAL